MNPYKYIDALEHSETCGCVECVQFVRFSGQTDPCGWSMSVTWSLDDNLAHAEGDNAESIRHLYATSGDGTPPSKDMLLGASGGAAPLTSVNAPNTEHMPVINRQGLRRWYGRVERLQGAP
jgi:hypothetical protein